MISFSKERRLAQTRLALVTLFLATIFTGSACAQTTTQSSSFLSIEDALSRLSSELAEVQLSNVKPSHPAQRVHMWNQEFREWSEKQIPKELREVIGELREPFKVASEGSTWVHPCIFVSTTMLDISNASRRLDGSLSDNMVVGFRTITAYGIADTDITQLNRQPINERFDAISGAGRLAYTMQARAWTKNGKIVFIHDYGGNTLAGHDELKIQKNISNEIIIESLRQLNMLCPIRIQDRNDARARGDGSFGVITLNELIKEQELKRREYEKSIPRYDKPTAGPGKSVSRPFNLARDGKVRECAKSCAQNPSRPVGSIGECVPYCERTTPQ
jgi:hypothetical protein